MALEDSGFDTFKLSYPPDYKIHEVGHDIAIIKDPVDLTDPSVVAKLDFYRIVGREKLAPKIHNVGAGDMPAAAGNFDLASASDFLESNDDRLDKFLVGFAASHYVEWEIAHPASNKRGGTRKETTGLFTEDDSPYMNPQIPINVIGTSQLPNFKFTNYSRYTLTWAKIKAIGFGYQLIPLSSKPPKYTVVQIGGIDIN